MIVDPGSSPGAARVELVCEIKATAGGIPALDAGSRLASKPPQQYPKTPSLLYRLVRLRN